MLLCMRPWEHASTYLKDYLLPSEKEFVGRVFQDCLYLMFILTKYLTICLMHSEKKQLETVTNIFSRFETQANRSNAPHNPQKSKTWKMNAKNCREGG